MDIELRVTGALPIDPWCSRRALGPTSHIEYCSSKPTARVLWLPLAPISHLGPLRYPLHFLAHPPSLRRLFPLAVISHDP